MTGRSLELFFVDGKPDGMLTAEVFNWTGHVLRIPRTRLVDGLKRQHAAQTGVYLLIGETDNGPLAYIGEAENMADRVKQHATARDWWDQTILITTSGDALHKAHVKYLESRLAETAIEAANIPLENGNAPPRSSLNEAATANMESFLETLHMVLPAIRVDMFQSGRRAAHVNRDIVTGTTSTKRFELRIPRHDIHATAELAADEMVVKAGSIVRAQWVGGAKHVLNYQKLHADLVTNGVIEVLSDGKARMTDDYAFSSPSAAAAIVSGRAANGRKEWKLSDGRTFEEWETAQLEAVTP
ncbi:GIY-YIG nuclease family protein [Salibaculum halophilum]|uniref:GIY-YIG nuclease family protein n=1 Tax=Salibaculum halophilum TaxID=1914408 RepID=UPI000A0F5F7D|nr:GIY-YIG nuclease family protein [Salibaculum halophilum]